MRSIVCLVALAASTLIARADTVSVFGFTSLPQNYENVVPFSLTNNGLTASFTGDVPFYADYQTDPDYQELFNETLYGTLGVGFSKNLSDLMFTVTTFSQGETVNLDTFLNGVLQSSQSVIVGDPVYSGPPDPVKIDLTGTFNSISVESRDFFGVTPLTATTATTPTPEPSTFALLGTGILGAAGVLRRKLIRL